MHHLLVIQTVEKSQSLNAIVWHKPCVIPTQTYKVELRITDRGSRVLSCEILKLADNKLTKPRTAKGEQIWVITKADRSVTTRLLPSED